MKLTFLGATGTVTGSCYLVETAGRKVLVDCGLFQGFKELRLRNWATFPVAPGDLDAVVLTHAHLDHCALVPLLFKYGYEGPVYSTPPTRDLSTMLLLDYLDVVRKETDKIPYTSNEVRTYMKHSIALNYGNVTDIAPDVKLTFHNRFHRTDFILNTAGSNIRDYCIYYLIKSLLFHIR